MVACILCTYTLPPGCVVCPICGTAQPAGSANAMPLKRGREPVNNEVRCKNGEIADFLMQEAKQAEDKFLAQVSAGTNTMSKCQWAETLSKAAASVRSSGVLIVSGKETRVHGVAEAVGSRIRFFIAQKKGEVPSQSNSDDSAPSNQAGVGYPVPHQKLSDEVCHLLVLTLHSGTSLTVIFDPQQTL